MHSGAVKTGVVSLHAKPSAFDARCFLQLPLSNQLVGAAPFRIALLPW
jgi:hypothetical protein